MIPFELLTHQLGSQLIEFGCYDSIIQGVSKFMSLSPFDFVLVAMYNELFSIPREREIVEVGLSKKMSKLYCYEI